MIADKVDDSAMVKLEASKVVIDELVEEAEKRVYAHIRPQPTKAYVWCFEQESAYNFASRINNNRM